MNNGVLVVDDEKGIRFAFSRALEKEGYTVYEAENGEQALNLFKENEPDVVLLDMQLPDMSGLEILKKIKETNDPVVIMMTAYGDIELAVEAMQSGAENFRMKPFNVEEMKNCIARSLENRKARTQLETIQAHEKQKYSLENIIGESKAINQVNQLIRKIAVSPSTTVLIQGPSGTGKELVARAIHYSSGRSSRPFLEVNCTAIPESLLESELFGHEKGAFTDAKKDRKGIFEQADGGSLFLDEIGDMPLQMQAKLLRVLQEKRFKRVGGAKDINVNVRVIASTNVDLEDAVKNATFRQDLFYRLNVIPIHLPPLNEREQDPLLIARFYLESFSREFKKKFNGFSAEAERVLTGYDWPGNVRELKNVIERAVLLENSSVIEADHLGLCDVKQYMNSVGEFKEEKEISEDNPKTVETLTVESFPGAVTLVSPSLKLEDVEKVLIEKALKDNNWNRNMVAKILGINRTTLYTKIKKYDLEKN